MINQNTKFWILHGPGWTLVFYLIYAQAISVFNYDLGVSMGTQESTDVISDVGVAFWYGFAFGDLVIYTPLLIVGLLGHWVKKVWGNVLLSAALGITIYWPVVCLAAVVSARNASGWNLTSEVPYWVVLPLIAFWGLWGLWYILINQADINNIS